MKTKIKVTKNDIANWGDSKYLIPLEAAIGRSLNTKIVIHTFGIVLGIFREDNQKYGWCLGYLPHKCYDFINNKLPFSFILEHHNQNLK